MAYVGHMNTDLLSTAEVAERAGVSIRTVARWVDAGRLTPVVIAPGPTGARLFDPRDVALFLAAERHTN
jgi:excisionase family DNA binding protein